MPSRTKIFLATLAVSTTMMVVAAPAHAAITPTSTASDLATAIAGPSATPTGSAFETIPGTGTPNGVGGSALAGFPTEGSTFGILTTGNVNLADGPNSSGSSGAHLSSSARGAFDVSILRVDLTVAPTQNCLRVDFRFLSEEYPEFVNSTFNDGFIAELDTSDWSVSEGSTISAPNNFAVDSNGDVVSINNSGVADMTAANAAGTTYDGATPELVAQTPITAGAHSVYFSIFDAGDHVYDSAVFLDNLNLGTEVEGECQAGVISEEDQTNLSIAKADTPDPVSAGEDIRYTVTVGNAGPINASNVVVTDTIPAGSTFLGAAGSGWACSFASGAVTCTRASIAVGETIPAINIDVQAPSTAGPAVNTATISADQPDADTDDNTATATTTVQTSSTADAATTFCANGCTLDTDPGTGATLGDPTVTFLIVPDDADPQTVSITEVASSTLPNFCDGSTCSGQIVTITGGDTDGGISGVADPNDPIIVKLVFDKTVKGGTQIYILKPGFTRPRLVANCTTPGVASPHPCVSTKIILPNGDREITVLLLSGDPSVGKR